jgi:predicted amidophosphoribosyltransferase
LKGFDAIFLFDDVATTGNTLNAAKNIIQNVVEKPIFLINIGQTKNPKHDNV